MKKKAIYYANSNSGFEADELKKCPFCGDIPEIIFIGNNHTKSRKVTIKCNKCRIERTNARRNKNES